MSILTTIIERGTCDSRTECTGDWELTAPHTFRCEDCQRVEHDCSGVGVALVDLGPNEFLSCPLRRGDQ